MLLLSGRQENNELIRTAEPVVIDVSFCKSSLSRGNDEAGCDCWSDPGGQGFMVRGRTYIQDNIKVRCAPEKSIICIA